MKRGLILLVVALALGGCLVATPARLAMVDEPATDIPGLICVTTTPTPCMVCPTCPAAGPTPTGTPAATATPVVQMLEWDPRLDDLHVTVQRVDGARYQIIAAWLTKNGNWDDVPAFAKKYQLDSLGGDHHLFGTCLDAVGSTIGNKTFIMTDGGIAPTMPMPDGWANQVLAGQNWDPANGPGPYSWQALKGDVLAGVGMPHNWHWSFFAVWRERPGYVTTQWERNGFAVQ